MSEAELRRRDAIAGVGATGDPVGRMAFALRYYAEATRADIELDGSMRKNVAQFAIACLRGEDDAAAGLYQSITGAPECSAPGCIYSAPHYHVEDADGEHVVWTHERA